MHTGGEGRPGTEGDMEGTLQLYLQVRSAPVPTSGPAHRQKDGVELGKLSGPLSEVIYLFQYFRSGLMSAKTVRS